METNGLLQRRRAARIAVDIAATVFLADHPASPDGSYPAASATIRNLSAGGALVTLPLLLYPGTRIRIEFAVRDRSYDRLAIIVRMAEMVEIRGNFNFGTRFLNNECVGHQPVHTKEHGRHLGMSTCDPAEKPLPIAATSTARYRIAQVSWNKVRIGDTLAADLETDDGLLLVSAGTQITGPMLIKLTNHVKSSGIHEPVFVTRR